MKHILILVLFLLKVTIVCAQALVVSADKANIAYLGFDNPLTIVADNCSCADIFAETDNGKLEKIDGCNFYYYPNRIGNAMIKIQERQNGKLKTVAAKLLKCKAIPPPFAMVGDRQSGPFPLAEFKLQQGVRVGFEQGFDLDYSATVTSFTIKLSSNGQVFYSYQNLGNRFTYFTIVAFNQLKHGDLVTIEHIIAIGTNFCPRSLVPLTFQMR